MVLAGLVGDGVGCEVLGREDREEDGVRVLQEGAEEMFSFSAAAWVRARAAAFDEERAVLLKRSSRARRFKSSSALQQCSRCFTIISIFPHIGLTVSLRMTM